MAFTKDLMKAIRKWRSEGCEVIVGIDANEDITVFSPTSFRYYMKSVGLTEAILHRHPRPQATYHRNKNNFPIDAIFASEGVKVLAGGYYAFDEFFAGDHRALWLDIDLTKTLGGVSLTKSSFNQRQLSTEDPMSVKRYVREVERQYEKYDILNRLTKLAVAVELNANRFTSKLERCFNCIHQQAYDIRRSAEVNCRKKAMGRVPWSPQVQELWDKMALWKILIKGRLKCRVSSRKVCRLMLKTGNPLARKLSTEELMAKLKEDRKEYKLVKKTKSYQWRKEHIDRHLKDAKKKKRRSKKSLHRFLRLRRMKQREEARRRRRARGKGFNGGLRAIQVPRETGNDEDLIMITDRKLVEQGCMDENQARYDQTWSPFPTPPMSEPLYSTFNGNDAEMNSKLLLEGALEIPKGVDKHMLAFLNQCRYKKNFEPMNLQVSVADHIAFWERANEFKGSEPHGLHNGHFKAGASSAMIAQCDTILRHLPLATGMVPGQWRNLTNFAIEKKTG